MTSILIVEDNEMNRDMLARRLSKKGFVVSTAIDGEEGLELVAAQKPDLVLMDMSLPRIDGWEATRRIKGDESTAKIPIIALTANALSEHREQAFAAGCDAFETKPVDMQRLLATINEFSQK